MLPKENESERLKHTFLTMIFDCEKPTELNRVSDHACPLPGHHLDGVPEDQAEEKVPWGQREERWTPPPSNEKSISTIKQWHQQWVRLVPIWLIFMSASSVSTMICRLSCTYYVLLFLLWAQITGTNLWDHGLLDIVWCSKSATMLMCVETDETAINLSLCNVSVGRLLSLGYKNLSFGIMCNMSQRKCTKCATYCGILMK